jgi:hypothetical protein
MFRQRLMNAGHSGMQSRISHERPLRRKIQAVGALQRCRSDPFSHFFEDLTMNRIVTTALLAASAGLTGHAFADDITPSEPFVSTAERAQVQAGVAQARTVANPWSIAYNPLATFSSSRTREEVRAEYMASRDEVAPLTGEDSGAFALAKQQQANAQLARAGSDAAAD